MSDAPKGAVAFLVLSVAVTDRTDLGADTGLLPVGDSDDCCGTFERAFENEFVAGTLDHGAAEIADALARRTASLMGFVGHPCSGVAVHGIIDRRGHWRMTGNTIVEAFAFQPGEPSIGGDLGADADRHV